MKQKTIILALVSSSMLALCIGLVTLSWVSSELLRGPQEPGKLVRITQVAPLKAPPAAVLPPAAKSPPGLMVAAVEQVVPIEAQPTATPSPTALASPTAAPLATASPTPTPTSAPITIQPGQATRLVIPKLSLDVPVLFAPVEHGTWQVDHLYQAVGHLEGTAPPGSNSNMVLAGHVTLSAGVYGPFANLGYLAPGDLVIVYEGDKEFLYLISGRQTVDSKSVEVVYPSETGEITLITCTNWSSTENRYTNRLVVKGRLIKG